MLKTRNLLTAMTLMLAWMPALAQDATEKPKSSEVTIGEKGSSQDPLDGRIPVIAVDPTKDSTTHKSSTAVDAPSLMLKIDPRVLGIAPGDPLPQLYREGESLRRRDGRLLPTGDRGYAVFILDADPQLGEDQPLAMVVAPCMTLESMERLLEDRGDDLRFTVSGQVHTYRGVNYLLPTSQPKPYLVEPAGHEAPASEQPIPELPDPSASNDRSQAEQSAAAHQPEESRDSKTPTADEVLGELLQKRAEAPSGIDRGADAGASSSSSGSNQTRSTDPLLLGLDPDKPQAELKEEGQFIVARTGRLVRSPDGSHALFVLDADKRGAPEPPLVMHACKLLETMEGTIREQGDNIPFVVTGQVYVYRGANYLLPTIVKREFERGNLE